MRYAPGQPLSLITTRARLAAVTHVSYEAESRTKEADVLLLTQRPPVSVFVQLGTVERDVIHDHHTIEERQQLIQTSLRPAHLGLQMKANEVDIKGFQWGREYQEGLTGGGWASACCLLPYPIGTSAPRL
ncbi:hypothetical protein DPEC_G00091050 [Dallia pectoralis]|uniref:Uncharacterized protein n=1 Tax=Dallia pectoralis TaxID=75939 RepID=A0ACC2H0S0_DALPE|nr:hypothetical protein DPEC_G00091050 [Dallia pectoralis]